MDSTAPVSVSVSEFVDLLNQTFEFAFPSIIVTGELANFKVSKNKWVYFDLKDDEATVRCFGTVFQLPGPLENGMLVHIKGMPHMHAAYGFSLSVQTIQPAGEGAIRRAAELLTAKLTAEGLFDTTRKRPIPYPPKRIGLITSAQSAAYADFIKILGARWGGIGITLADVQVQGEAAPQQIINALAQFNALTEPPDVLVLIRGGGSADDLAAFSHEGVVRAIAGSRVPTLAAIGHEIDTSLAELAADGRASTPSNAAELLVPDKRTVLETVSAAAEHLYDAVQDVMHDERHSVTERLQLLHVAVTSNLNRQKQELTNATKLLEILNPEQVLRRGYAVVRHEGTIVRSVADLSYDGIVEIQLADSSFDAQVINIRKP